MDDSSSKLPHQRAAKVRGNLPPEFELAQLTKDIENPFPSWNASTPACEWKGVTCGDGIHISAIYWDPKSHIPPHLRSFYAYGNGFSGRLHWQHLPQSLKKFRIERNKLQGSVNLTRLPQGLTSLSLSRNMFSGNVVLDCLPQNMTYLNLGNNQFTGCLDFRHLPLTLTSLSCNDNKFDTLVHFYSVPLKLSLHLQNNPGLQGVLEKPKFINPVVEKYCEKYQINVNGTKLIIL